MIFKIKIGRYNMGFSFFGEGKKEVYGYTNRCGDGRFIVFLDYDSIPFKWVLQELKYLQADFHLGDFYILESSKGNYHAICFSKVTREELGQILRNSSIDEHHLNIPFTIGKKLLTLRLTDKKGKGIKFWGKLDTDLFSHKRIRLESKEHKIFFNNYFGNIIKPKEFKANNDILHTSNLVFSKYKIKE